MHWEDLKLINSYNMGEGRGFRMGNKYIYLWRIQFDIWHNQYNIVKLKNKIKFKKKKKEKKGKKKNLGMEFCQCPSAQLTALT